AVDATADRVEALGKGIRAGQAVACGAALGAAPAAAAGASAPVEATEGAAVLNAVRMDVDTACRLHDEAMAAR
ncbi:MAG: hypothetical protein HOV68_22855, partial [Streptomycetaceae bacterium]|nr:hypothetical protein [Streptomycetaceae bacterium]